MLSSTYVGTSTPARTSCSTPATTPSPGALEEAIGALEGSRNRALAFSSGMAAITAALSLVPNGGTW